MVTMIRDIYVMKHVRDYVYTWYMSGIVSVEKIPELNK